MRRTAYSQCNYHDSCDLQTDAIVLASLRYLVRRSHFTSYKQCARVGVCGECACAVTSVSDAAKNARAVLWPRLQPWNGSVPSAVDRVGVPSCWTVVVRTYVTDLVGDERLVTHHDVHAQQETTAMHATMLPELQSRDRWRHRSVIDHRSLDWWGVNESARHITVRVRLALAYQSPHWWAY